MLPELGLLSLALALVLSLALSVLPLLGDNMGKLLDEGPIEGEMADVRGNLTRRLGLSAAHNRRQLYN